MIDLILLAQAENDIQLVFDRCEDVQEGRGEIFLSMLDFAFGNLRRYPELGPVYAGPYRRLLVRDFPYGVFYQQQPGRIVVAAILDLRQHPAAIKRKLF